MSMFNTSLQQSLFGTSDQNCALAAKQYPKLFAHPQGSYSWPAGWHTLVLQACELLQQRRPDARWIQVKEKLGGLRLYVEGGPLRADIHTEKGLLSLSLIGDEPQPDDLFVRLQSLEIESRRTCACCGAAGALAKVDRYYITLCTDCTTVHGACVVPLEA